MLAARRTVYSLGLAGLIPFVVPALVLVLHQEQSALAQHIVNVYAFGIICFLCGTWWGMALREGNRRALLLSNLIFLIAFFGFFILPNWWALMACLLLVSLFIIELNTSIIPAFSSDYRTLRATLTLVAGASMLFVFLAS